MRLNILEAVTGAIVLVIASVFFFYVYSSTGVQTINGYHLLAKFDRIDGLLQGNDVKLSGVKVGDVSRISIDPKTYLAVVDMTIDKGVHLPTDTNAQITSESLLGGKYIALVPGGDDDLLKEGETIAYTQSSISFEGLIGKFLFSKTDEEDPKKSKAS